MALELRLIEQKFWQISPYLAEYLAVNEGEAIRLHVGANTCEVIVRIHDNYTCMNLNKQWASDLKLTPGKWKVKRISDGIQLGPIIGIVCEKLPSQPPAESSWNSYLTAIDSGQGILLTPEGFDLEHRRVFGLTLSEDKQHWVEGEMPWPNALYVRTYPLDASTKSLLHKEFAFRHFNTEDIPISVPIRQELSDIMEESQCIRQHVVLMSENDHRTCNFRVLMQKKDDGLWHITGLWGRSGTIRKVRLRKEIHRLSLLVALTLEEYAGQLGEIGLDILIDNEEHLWILEVNRMPGKEFITEFCSSNVTQNVYMAPMLYAAYLSGFSEVIYPLA